MNRINFEQFPYHIHIIRSHRRTVQIRVVGENSIEIRVPIRLSDKRVQQILVSKEQWIHRHLSTFESLEPTLSILDGTSWPCFGMAYTMLLAKAEVNKVVACFEGELLKVTYKTYDEAEVQKAIKAAYIERLRPYITKQVQAFSEIMGVQATGFRIKSQKSLWGSCSSKKHLNFNWRIAFAPVEVVDYLIIHEMCHLKHMNHGKDFWRMVETYDPNYQQHKLWLKHNNRYLQIAY